MQRRLTLDQGALSHILDDMSYLHRPSQHVLRGTDVVRADGQLVGIAYPVAADQDLWTTKPSFVFADGRPNSFSTLREALRAIEEQADLNPNQVVT